ncbi:MAG TPA: helix-turn-helix domain-containing protein [Ignavibacteria bacterium]|nr:helix-turn-helix domain-containing protein [Ignavibacteria bacterium]HMQ98243.1 helix-turn-helix domain-containing protein [Ignavibacteria bacterium]
MQTSTLNPGKRRVRTGFYSEVTRDNAFGLSMDSHQPQKLRVYAALIHSGKLTRHQLADKLSIPLHTICARVKALMDDGLVIDTEKTIMNSVTNTPNNLVEAVVKELSLF